MSYKGAIGAGLLVTGISGVPIALGLFFAEAVKDDFYLPNFTYFSMATVSLGMGLLGGYLIRRNNIERNQPSKLEEFIEVDE